jgi:hypothetical protein
MDLYVLEIPGPGQAPHWGEDRIWGFPRMCPGFTVVE